MAGKIVRCFLDTHMGLSHDGLREVAKRHGLDLLALKNSEYVVFVNRSHDRCKIFAERNIFAYWRAAKGSKLDLTVIREIPRAFNGTSIMEYDRALEVALTQRLDQSPRRSRLSALDAMKLKLSKTVSTVRS